MTIVTTRYRYKRPSRKKPKAAAIEGPTTVTSPDRKHPPLPDHPNPTYVIVRPQKAAPLPAWKDGDPHAPAEAAKRLWLELVRRTEEAVGKANKPDAKSIKRRSR
jgi:hypothetical protein